MELSDVAGVLVRDPTARVGLICNPRSHRNRGSADAIRGHPGVVAIAPRTRDDLDAALAGFAARGIELLLIDGGDGTVRDVLTAGGAVWPRDAWPRIAIVPSGKTNALAHDLGIGAGWTREQAIQAAERQSLVTRAPLAIERPGARRTPLSGFLLGAGAFVRGTELAQRTHRAGAFDNFAVGLSIGWSVLTTMVGRGDNPWRVGEAMRISGGGAAIDGDRARYLALVSTLERLPVGVRPFGRPRAGMKLLAIDAPPRRMVLAAPAIVRGSEAAWLPRAGYHRADPQAVTMHLDRGFVLDGELYKGGELSIRPGPDLAFVVP